MTDNEKRSTGRTPLIILAVVSIVVSGCVGLGFIAAFTPDDEPTATEPFPAYTFADATPSTVPSKPVKRGTSTPIRIKGDSIVHVGEDVPAGTYRAATEVEGELCGWIKSRDPEGQKLVAAGAPRGGRPQVVLKGGDWFNSFGCPDWVRK